MSIVQLIEHKPRAKASYAYKLRNADEAMNVLRVAMHTWDYKDLAKHVGVSNSCIMSVRSGRTKWPRPHTFFGLLEALELEMHLVQR